MNNILFLKNKTEDSKSIDEILNKNQIKYTSINSSEQIPELIVGKDLYKGAIEIKDYLIKNIDYLKNL